MKWTELKDGLMLEGVAIAEGTYTGIDGNTIFYPREVLEKAYKTLVGKKLKLQHRDDDESVIGYVTAATFDEEKAQVLVKVKVFNTGVKEQLKEYMSFSPEITVYADNERSDSGVVTAGTIEFTGLALVREPACPVSNILSVQTVAMQKSKEEEKMDTMECAKKLKEVGWEKLSDECKEILRKNGGYPYPEPTPSKNEAAELERQLAEKEKQIEELRGQIKALQEKIVELQQELEKRDMKELEKLKEEVQMANVDALLEKLPDTKTRIEVLKTLLEEQKKEKQEEVKIELSRKSEDKINDEDIEKLVKSWMSI